MDVNEKTTLYLSSHIFFNFLKAVFLQRTMLPNTCSTSHDIASHLSNSDNGMTNEYGMNEKRKERNAVLVLHV